MIPEEHKALKGTIASKHNTLQDLSNIYFHTPSEWAKNNLFFMEASGSFTCTKQYRIERNTTDLFDSYLAILTLSGSGTIVTPLGERICTQDSIALIDCNAPHTYYANEQWNFFWFHFNGISTKAFLQLLLDGHSNVFYLSNSQSIVNNFLLLRQYKSINTLNDELAISSYIHQILSQTYTATHTEHPSDKRSILMAKAMEYIDQHYSSDLTVDEVASLLNISKSSFCHLFRAGIGFSPYDYILTTRINKAKHLLRYTSQNISEIAWSVGFKSNANFIQVFRKKTDMTPSQFRHSLNI